MTRKQKNRKPINHPMWQLETAIDEVKRSNGRNIDGQPVQVWVVLDNGLKAATLGYIKKAEVADLDGYDNVSPGDIILTLERRMG